jgi:hypothetical protein
MKTEPAAKTAIPPARLTWLDACLLASVLLLCTAISFRVAALHKLENDELLSAWTDRLPTARQVLSVQMHWPISLDPPVYHLLAHASMKVFGVGQFADRFPAIVGFLLMQVALFVLVRRIAGARAAIVAATLPALTAGFLQEATDARPYALLLGLYASALLCWQLAKTAQTPRRRSLARIALAATLIITLFTHFFGVLILVPICVAEAVDAVSLRRVDWATAAAVGVTLLTAPLLLPFTRAVAPYKAHYWSTYVHPDLIYRSYLFTLIGATHEQHPHLAQLCTFGFAVLVVAWSAYALRHRDAILPGLCAGVVALALLPFFGYLLAGHITHTIELRHVLPTLVALPIMLGVLLGPQLTRTRFATLKLAGLMAAMLAVIAAQGAAHVREVAHTVPDFIRWTHRWPPLADSPEGRSHQPIYTNSVGLFLMIEWYQPDPNIRDRLTLVYDSDRELQWNRMDTLSITAMNLRHFSRFRIVPFATVLAEPRPLILSDDFTWNWMTPELKREGKRLLPIGMGLGGTVNAVLPNTADSTSPPAR